MRLSDIQKGAHIPGESGNSTDIPPWMDMDKFKRGQEVFTRNGPCMFLAMHVSLVVGMLITNLLEPLVFTKQSDTPAKSFKRYRMTGYYLYLWHTGDVWDPDTKAHRSVQAIRKMHNGVAKAMNKTSKNGKVYFSQYDMSLVQSGFFGAILMRPYLFGMRCTRQELEDYVFFWRGIGYLLGISDEYNMCKEGFQGAYDVSKDIEKQLLIPAFYDPPKDFDRMADAYVKGTNEYTKLAVNSKASIIAFAAQMGDVPEIAPKLTLVDRLRLWHIKFTVWIILWVPFVKTLFGKMAFMLMDRMDKTINI